MAEAAGGSGADYVRKDVFDARMDRLEALQAKTVAEIKVENEKLRSETDGKITGLREEIGELRGEVRVNAERAEQQYVMLNARIDSLQTSVNWGFAFMTVLLGILSFSPAIAAFLRSFRKPSVPVEEIEAVVNAAIEKYLGKLPTTGGK